jgi:hypothetical protein
VFLTVQHAAPGTLESQRRECETDILVVYETSDGRRLALHIENKLANGSFTKDQPELYRARKDQWKGRENLGNYSEAMTVLIAPQRFYDRHRPEVDKFDAYISHEAIAEHIDRFKYCLSERAV